jgi:hypothetical protein
MVENLPKILPPGRCLGCGAMCNTTYCDGCAPALPGARFPMPDEQMGAPKSLARVRHRRNGRLHRTFRRPPRAAR